ncbi:MAG: hypothetical protein M3Q56_08590 [Bacteroidota bacterium]|nr:hypothetical protein [Bacteroidota bacterium]
MYPESSSEKIFKYISERFYNGNKEYVDDLCGILNLQKSTVYKKLRGESPLHIDDACLLAEHFKLSLDEIMGLSKGRIYFDFPAMHQKIKNSQDYLEPIVLDLERLLLVKPKIYYATKELPLFYYFSSPALAAFKFHVFYNIIWREDKNAWIKFSLNQYILDQQFINQTRKISELYMNFDSNEIWNINILDNTLNQIRYFLESGLYEEAELSLSLCDEMSKLLEIISKTLETGNKSHWKRNKEGGGFINIFNNEIAHTNNVIYIKSESIRAVYSTYDNPNFMRSLNTQLCDYTESWFHRLEKHSSALTLGNVKDRKNFINYLQVRIEKTKLWVETFIKSNAS